MGHTKKIFFLKTDLQLLIETEPDRKLDKSAKNTVKLSVFFAFWDLHK